MSQEARGIKRGDYYAQCDVCGRKLMASTMKVRWDSLFVCDIDYEERHPQDFIEVHKEDRKVPISRPVRINTTENVAEFNPVVDEADTTNWYSVS